MFLVPGEILLKTVIWLPLAAFITVVSTRLITGLQYHYTLRQLRRAASGGRGTVVDAPVLPYWVPFLEHAALMIRRERGGLFWSKLLARHPRDAGVCCLHVGGKRIKVLWNVTAINAMFKNRANVNKGDFDRDLWVKAFAMPPPGYESLQAHHHVLREINLKLLLRHNAVDEMTPLFIERLVAEFTAQPDGERELGLWEFFRRTMFAASVDTSFGTKLRQKIYPDMIRDFDQYDVDMPTFYFGLPRFMAPSMYTNREKILERMRAWAESNGELKSKECADPEEKSPWDPNLGSSYTRAKRAASIEAGFCPDSMAAADMAFILGLSSNVIRTTGWMVLNVVGSSDTTLLPRVQKEITKAKIEGSRSLDIARLVSSPLLQSLWTEALRCYVDNYTARDIVKSMDLPMDEFGRYFLRVNAGDLVFVANYPLQIDPAVWGEDAFRADRFVMTDADGGETFQGTSKIGKVSPFGAGPEKCPGRIFAKQEAIAALALFFAHFDFEKIGMIDGDGKPTDCFPTSAPMVAGGGALCPEGDIRVRLSKRAGF